MAGKNKQQGQGNLGQEVDKLRKRIEELEKNPQSDPFDCQVCECTGYRRRQEKKGDRKVWVIVKDRNGNPELCPVCKGKTKIRV